MQAMTPVGLGERASRFFSVVAIALAVALPAAPRQVARVDPALDGDAIVSVAHGESAHVADFARRAGAQDVRSLDGLDAVTARLDATATRALAANVMVKAIEADGEIVASGLVATGGPFPTGSGEQNLIGPYFRLLTMTRPLASVTVAVVDSGVDDNRELAGKVLTRVDFVNDDASSFDPGGHGTFIAGLIAGSMTGVASNAKIVSLRVLNASGVGRIRDALAAFDWLLRHHAEYGIGVVNVSWGARQTRSYNTDVLAAAAESLWFAGMTVVTAAGNYGPQSGTVNTPGADPFVITVGAVDQMGTLVAGDDREAEWSSRGPTLDRFMKPDLLAIGIDVVSLRVPGSFLDKWYAYETTTFGSSYIKLSGTSVSSAVVSGMSALILGQSPRFTPTFVKTALVSSATHVKGSKTSELDPAAALKFKSQNPRQLANQGLKPSQLLLQVLAEQLAATNITWENITWENITWETITWENVSWESLTWETVTWETVCWEALTK